MKATDFDYNLPPELIAQHPASPRDASRLMLLDRSEGSIEQHIFRELADLLKAGDVLVLNDSKVLPARLFGRKDRTGAHLETLLLRDLGAGKWEALVKPAKRVKVGTKIYYRKFFTRLWGEVMEELGEGRFVIQFSERGGVCEGARHAWPLHKLAKALARLGQAPLPPYISQARNFARPQMVKKDYQTIYARDLGSAAAPTAGLHFTDRVFKNLREKGIQTEFVTLHVGLGTFLPVKTDDIKDHKMHSEYFTLAPETAERLNQAKQAGRRIIAVGTTSVRVLESCTIDGVLKPQTSDTEIFIYPGYKWKFVDGLLTNFHLPKSTLLMLVSAFASREFVLKAYEEAKKEQYRFYSFGDAMLIL
ncbi:MAG: tRNA preQ1(34) S-adenosylmethionine ribosyltransferase-isomerase QueA [Candidatus Gracilibacteria bacterium]|nr:tRNA preQ1(34) S-adenosylmethionine ribosyltransferase-isomerase QueA [Candidatus Gracilibacteria bacterium]